MDDLNYRRLMKYQKRRCEESGATAYMDPQGIFRSIIEDHERFETCFDCGYLVGWCPAPETCEQPVWVAERNPKPKPRPVAPVEAAPAAEAPVAVTPNAAKKSAKKAPAQKAVKKTAAQTVPKKAAAPKKAGAKRPAKKK